MIGVILWCDSTDQKAVIWCEDQGDLAFLSRPDCVHLPDTFFEVGDVVQFDVSTRRNMRLAHNTSRLADSWGLALAKDLKTRVDPAAVVPQDAGNIIPFRLEAERRAKAALPHPRRLQGQPA